jgi:hypothetical protein
MTRTLGAQFLLETSMPRAWLRDLSRGQVRAGPQHEASLFLAPVEIRVTRDPCQGLS